jgi:hypothetical protein
MILIGLGNKARQGKDLAALAIMDYYGFKRDDQELHDLPVSAPYVQRVGFADELYRVAREEYGMVEKDAPLLQRIGHERRQTDPEYWIKKAFAKFKPKTDIGIITDVRYQNEAESIKACGGYVVNITRKVGAVNLVADDRPADHPSEIDLDGYPFDFYLVNVDGHQAWLAQQAICLVEYLRGLHS